MVVVKLPGDIPQPLAASGIRLTKQREQVLGVLMQKPDHPTATEVFLPYKEARFFDLAGYRLQLSGSAGRYRFGQAG